MTDYEYKGVPGLGAALCALSYFRRRHVLRPMFKHAKRYSGRKESQYRESVRLAHKYIALARSSGWRGSIRNTVEHLANPREKIE